MNSRIRNCLVVGAGAVGLGVASFLHQGGAAVRVLARGDAARSLRRFGLRRDGALETYSIPPGGLAVAESLGELRGQRFDAIFVCVKAYDADGVALSLADCPGVLANRGSLVLCQNGWGNAEVFARHLPAASVLNACVFTGFERPGPGRVRVTSHLRLLRVGALAGSAGGRAASVCGVLAAGGLPAEPAADIARDLWEKMLFNCSVNPLSALLGVSVGELASAARLRPVIAGLVAETFAVLRAAGFRAHSATPADYLEAFYRDLAPAAGGHPPSMLQDLRRGRRTEIDALNGAVVRLGVRVGVAAPRHRLVRDLVRSAEGRLLHESSTRSQGYERKIANLRLLRVGTLVESPIQ